MKKKKVWMFVIILILLLGGIGLGKFLNIPTEPSNLITEETVTMSAVEQIFFDKFEEKDFTCTGLAFDQLNKTFWIADYGTDESKENKPRLVEIDSNFNAVIRTINLDDIYEDKFNLQGISYDKKNDSLWLAVGNEILEINKNGTVMSIFTNDLIKKYKANGIAVDEKYIWVLCYKRYLLKFDRDGNMLRRYDFNFSDQDQICLYEGNIYCTVGADYEGNNNYIFQFNPNTETIKNFARINNSNAIEGITIFDREIYIVNDGKFHNDILNKSYISKYKFLF